MPLIDRTHIIESDAFYPADSSARQFIDLTDTVQGVALQPDVREIVYSLMPLALLTEDASADDNKTAKAKQAARKQQFAARLPTLADDIAYLAANTTDGQRVTLLLSGDTDYQAVSHALPQILPHIDAVTIYFAGFRDGRGYSLAQSMRMHPDFGDTTLRALGDILPDTLELLMQVGFSQFIIDEQAFNDAWFAYFDSIRHPYDGRSAQELPMFSRAQAK